MGRPSHHFDKKAFFYLVELQDACEVLNQHTVHATREITAATWNVTLEELAAIERRGIAMGWLERYDVRRETAELQT
jgi:hypothetical protein